MMEVLESKALSDVIRAAVEFNFEERSLVEIHNLIVRSGADFGPQGDRKLLTSVAAFAINSLLLQDRGGMPGS